MAEFVRNREITASQRRHWGPDQYHSQPVLLWHSLTDWEICWSLEILLQMSCRAWVTIQSERMQSMIPDVSYWKLCLKRKNLSLHLVPDTSTLLSTLSSFNQYSNHYINSITTIGTVQENHKIIDLSSFCTFRGLNFFPAVSL